MLCVRQELRDGTFLRKGPKWQTGFWAGGPKGHPCIKKFLKERLLLQLPFLTVWCLEALPDGQPSHKRAHQPAKGSQWCNLPSLKRSFHYSNERAKMVPKSVPKGTDLGTKGLWYRFRYHFPQSNSSRICRLPKLQTRYSPRSNTTVLRQETGLCHTEYLLARIPAPRRWFVGTDATTVKAHHMTKPIDTKRC